LKRCKANELLFAAKRYKWKYDTLKFNLVVPCYFLTSIGKLFFMGYTFFLFSRKKERGTTRKKGLLAYELMRLPHIYSAPQFVLINLLLIFQTCEPTIVLDGWRKQGT
jgi:hypothetical protein